MVFRKLWADYFDEQNVNYAFFSAANAAALQDARREAAEVEARLQEHEALASTSVHDVPSNGHIEGQLPPRVADGDMESGDAESDSSEKSQDLSDEEYSDEDSEYRGTFLPIDQESDVQDPRIRVLSVLELEDLFVRSAPDLSSTFDRTILSSFADSTMQYLRTPRARVHQSL